MNVVTHGHGLGGGCPFVEKGGVGHGESREIGDHRLEVEERLEPPLGDLRLVRSVLSVPGGVLQDVADDHGGDVCVVVPHPDEGLEDLVLGGELGHVSHHLALGEASVEFGELHRVDSDLFRDGVVDQGVDVVVSAVFRHVRLLVRRRGVVAARESVSRLNRIDGDRTRLVMVVVVVVVFGEIDGSVVVVGEERGEGRDVPRRSVGDDGRDVVRGDLAVTVSFRFVNEASHDASVSEPTCALHGDW